jgi:hypothetical protein
MQKRQCAQGRGAGKACRLAPFEVETGILRVARDGEHPLAFIKSTDLDAFTHADVESSSGGAKNT